MAATPETIVIDAGKQELQHTQAQEIRAKMLQDSIGSVGKNIMDIVTQYQDLKSQKQKQDLASMTMAGTLSGGMDKLPQDTKNKLPGILGVNLPTDDQGNVQITPDTDTVIKRMTLDLIKQDPNAQRILAGLQEKQTDPFKLANDVKLREMQVASQKEKDAQANWRTQEANTAKIDAALIGERSRVEAANIAAGAKGKSADDAPSPFVLDPKTNTMMSEPQWYSTYPGQQIPTKLSFKDAKIINDKNKTDSSTAARNSTIAANQARVRTLDFKLNSAMSNQDPNNLVNKQIKHLTDLAKLSAGTNAEIPVKEMINKQMPQLLKGMGYGDDDIAALTTTTGEGGWFSYLANLAHSWAGTTATDTGPSLKQPDTDHIHGVSTSIPTPAGGSVPSTGGGASQTTTGSTLTPDQFKQQYGRK